MLVSVRIVYQGTRGKASSPVPAADASDTDSPPWVRAVEGAILLEKRVLLVQAQNARILNDGLRHCRLPVYDAAACLLGWIAGL